MPGTLLHRASKTAFRHMEAAFAKHGLPYSHWMALSLIVENHAKTASAVADCMGFYPRAATRLLDRLERDGLLTRSRDQGDRRIVNVRLAKAGITAVERGRPLAARRWSELLAGFSRDEVDFLTNMLRGVVVRAGGADNPI
jgi:MarR family transcriptional regulator, temperature-dependent positive regulator of motility